MKGVYGGVLYLFVFITSEAFAYEIHTHAAITERAFNKVLSQDKQFIARLGLMASEESSGTFYYDVSEGAIRERHGNPYEEKIFRNDLELPVKAFSPAGWLLRGAIREDDGAAALFLSNPQDDDFGNINRFFHHFFDPVNNVPLNGVPTPNAGGAVHTAPAWALGTTNTDAFTEENTAESGRRNHYSVKDAREYMFRALTGMDKSGSRAIAPNGSGGAREPNDAAEGYQVRRAYWATTFRALGDIVHLVQDMGQPQHTRNEPHSPINIVNGERVYEAFTNQRALGGRYTCFFGFGRVDEVPALDDVYGAYSTVPKFTRYGDFFSTGAGSASGVAAGKGLADYSNRGFFTAGTNVGMARNIYSSPSLAAAQAVPLGKVSPCFPPGGEAVAFKGIVNDTFDTNQTADNVPLTTRGLWDRGEYSDPQVRYSLNEQNYIAMADLLIPRAVAYSAGLIDYFFRGRLEISPPDEGVYAIVDHAVVKGIDQGFDKIKLKLRNVTPAIVDGPNTYPQNMGPGHLYAVVKFRRNPCYQPDLSGEVQAGTTITDPTYCRTPEEQIVVSDAIAVQSVNTNDPQSQTFTFSTAVIPINATDVYLQVVFRGELGSEADAVAVATKDISEPSFISVTNSTDYVGVEGTLYKTEDIDTDNKLVIDAYGNNNGEFDEDYNPFLLQDVMVGFTGASGYLIMHDSLPPQASIRIAVLQDLAPGENMKVVAIKSSRGSLRYDFSGFGRVNQVDENNVPRIDGIDHYDNLAWVGPFRGLHHERGLYVFQDTYDPNHRVGSDWTYDVSGLALLDNLNPMPVDHMLVNFE